MRAAKGTDAVKVVGLVCESMAERATQAKKAQDATQAANALVNLQESEDFGLNPRSWGASKCAIRHVGPAMTVV